MRSACRISLLLLCCIFLAHCSDHTILGELHRGTYDPDVTVGDLSEPIPVGYDQTVLVEEENLLITFAKVTDGRCPTGACCFWEGQANTEFRVAVPDAEPKAVTPVIRPSSDPDTNRDMTDYAFDYSFTLLRLEPYPHVDRDLDIDDYVATLHVARVTDDGTVYPLYRTRNDPLRLQRDPVNVLEGSIEGDVLTLTVQYGGGCGNHAVRLYWRGDWMESYPVQSSLFFQHVNIDDYCEAFISREASFSIREIAEDYREAYGGYDDIILNVYGYFEDEPDQKIRVTYSPR